MARTFLNRGVTKGGEALVQILADYSVIYIFDLISWRYEPGFICRTGAYQPCQKATCLHEMNDLCSIIACDCMKEHLNLLIGRVQMLGGSMKYRPKVFAMHLSASRYNIFSRRIKDTPQSRTLGLINKMAASRSHSIKRF